MLGGKGTGISIHSAHRKEAIEFLRYQLHALMQSGEKGKQRRRRGAYRIVRCAFDIGAGDSDGSKPEEIVARPSAAGSI